MNGSDQSQTNPLNLDLDALVPCDCWCGGPGKGRWYRRRCSREGLWRFRLVGPPREQQAEAVLRRIYDMPDLTETVVSSEIICDECAGHWVEWACRNLTHRVVSAERI